MLLRPKHEAVESPCSILRLLENTPDPAQDAGAHADLKQILRNRIAVLEAQEALASKSYDDKSTERAAQVDDFKSAIRHRLQRPLLQNVRMSAFSEWDQNGAPGGRLLCASFLMLGSTPIGEAETVSVFHYAHPLITVDSARLIELVGVQL